MFEEAEHMGKVVWSLTLLGFLMAGSAVAGNSSDCESSDVKRSIKGCTALIKAGKMSKANLAIAYHNRAHSLKANAELDAAIADFSKAVSLNKKYASAYRGRGNTFYAKGEYEKALEDFNEAIRLAPKRSITYYDRGYAFFSLNKTDEAIADFSKALSGDPKLTDAFFGRAAAQTRKGEHVSWWFYGPLTDLLVPQRP